MQEAIRQGMRSKVHWIRPGANAPVYLCFLVILVATVAAVSRHGMPFPAAVIYTNLDLYLKGFGLFLVFDGTVQLWKHRPKSPIGFLKERYTSPEMSALFLDRLPLLFVFVSFLPLFAVLKPLIPLVNSYTWDAALIGWDVAIFGTDPWRLLQPLIGYPAITAALAILYHAWFGLIYPGSLIFIYLKRANAIRRQYLLTFMLMWFVGGFLVAAGMSSVGPCFLQAISGDNHFSDQMAYLHQANEQFKIVVLDMQSSLLQNHLENGPGFGAGITAMPSMHVAVAFLFWLGIRQMSVRAGRWFFAFFLIIWVGSVHLAYHYAVDGLVSILLVAFLWKASGMVIKTWDTMREQIAARQHV